MTPYRTAVAVSLAIYYLRSQSIVSCEMITNEASASPRTTQGQQWRQIASMPVVKEQQRSLSSENRTSLYEYLKGGLFSHKTEYLCSLSRECSLLSRGCLLAYLVSTRSRSNRISQDNLI
jgi:hypothetical protein